MDKKAYLEEWNTQNDSYQTDLRLLQEQLNNIKDTKGEYVFNLWPWFGIGMILSSILGGIIGWYALQNVMYLAIMVLVFPGIVYLSWMIIHNYKNKTLIDSKRSESSLRTRIENDITDLNIRDGNIKYDLAINFVGYHLAYFNIFRDYYGYFAESTVEYGQVFNKSNGKSITGVILKSFAGIECQVIASNQEWRNVYEVPMFHLIGISKKYRNSKINITKESTMNATFIASQPKRGFKNLSVMDPSQTEKRNWPKRIPELNGEYYPEVSQSSNELEVFKFFTPRIIDFFLNDDYHDVAAIANNDIFFNSINVNWDRFEVPDRWRYSHPDRVEEEINSFATSKYPAGINLDLVDEILKRTDTLHR